VRKIAADLTGGSGLYFKALTHGCRRCRRFPAEIREPCARGSNVTASRRCTRIDAARSGIRGTGLKPRDRIRIARALEVVEATGRSLDRLASRRIAALLPPGHSARLFLSPHRDQLYARIDSRYEAIAVGGALEESRMAARARSVAAGDEGPWRSGADRRAPQGETSPQQAAVIGRADTRHYASGIHLVPAQRRIRMGAAGRGEGWFDQNRGFIVRSSCPALCALCGNPSPTSGGVKTDGRDIGERKRRRPSDGYARHGRPADGALAAKQ